MDITSNPCSVLLRTHPALSIHIRYHVITEILVLFGLGETFIILCEIYWMRQLSEYCCNDKNARARVTVRK